MDIDTLIEKLQEKKQKYGNISVMVESSDAYLFDIDSLEYCGKIRKVYNMNLLDEETVCLSVKGL